MRPTDGPVEGAQPGSPLGPPHDEASTQLSTRAVAALRVPELGVARAWVWVLIGGVLLAGTGHPSAPHRWFLGASDAGCVLRTTRPASSCPCSELSGPFRRALDLPLPLDRASVVDLQALDGIGPMRAQAIIRDREMHGAFRDVQALVRVRGIGAATARRLASQLFTSGPDPACQGDLASLVAKRVYGREPRGPARGP